MKAVMTKTISLILAAGMILSPAAVMADPESEAESVICSFLNKSRIRHVVYIIARATMRTSYI